MMYHEHRKSEKTLAPTEEIETAAGSVLLYYQCYCRLVSEDRWTSYAH